MAERACRRDQELTHMNRVLALSCLFDILAANRNPRQAKINDEIDAMRAMRADTDTAR
jgi:hypothetical protein